MMNYFNKYFQYVTRRYTVSVTLLTLYIAGYQATILNLAYYKQVSQVLNIRSFTDILFALSMPVVACSVVFVVLNLLTFPKLIKLAGVLLVLLGAPLTYFMLTFGIVINRDMLQNVLETTVVESATLMTPSLFCYFLCLGVIPALAIIIVKVKPVRRIWRYLLTRALSIVSAVLIVIVLALLLYKNYAAFFRNNHTIIKYFLPSNYIAAIYKQYDYLHTSTMPFINIGKDAYRKTPVQNNGKKTVMILLLGETARAQNFALNGYAKNTNPRLSKREDSIFFSRTSSCGTFTAYSVPCMFSSMTRTQYDAKQAENQSNILDILQSTGINLLWQENDGDCKGVCARIKTVDVTKQYRDTSPLCKNGVCYDEILLANLENYINKLTDDALITLHMIGSHGPTYYERYPDQFNVFQPTCDTKEINHCDQPSLINTYDNTIVYTDYVIDKAIALLDNYRDKFNVALMYVSDHGESLGENGLYLHSMPYAVAPAEQTQIPFFLWMSTGFKQQKGINMSCMKQQAIQQSFSHDNLFHSLLGAFNIQSSVYQPILDIFATCQAIDNSQ